MSFAGKKVEQEVKVVQLKKLIEFFLVSEVKNINSQCLVKHVFLNTFCFICCDLKSWINSYCEYHLKKFENYSKFFEVL